ncbi:hypothetical protein BCR37DRAFT_380811 [Protomyces lactucae-debilis]|uniref:Phosphotransferase n=1 Tax=Protomyces lactucae-debilis TaxID=2754530 RepID=A0A1Y2FAH7_PROLT|nr:uncharacterized protein BCR37DRAFT_380811 [Protomyces lactucae-debilis]ORY80932.1 hypothetical protein BCR37DRAFT_380811 [Protomyces lactucae-debilis]
MEAFLDSLQSSLALSDEQIKDYTSALRPQITADYAQDESMMLPSFVYARPSGNERGEFLAIELGGTMLRLAIVGLSGLACASEFKRSKSWSVPDAFKVTGSGRDLFHWIAQRVSEVIGIENHRKWKAGFTFSFPVQETSISTGQIKLMGKGFASADDENECINVCLSEALKSIGVNVELCAILNDSIATLLAQAYTTPGKTSLSLILGTGCNSAAFACSSLFEAKLKNRGLIDGQSVVAVNCELSMFGKMQLPWTKYDHEVDQTSTRPGYQPLEQFTSGRYLGELVRRIWLDCPGRSSVCPKGFDKAFGLSGRIVSGVEMDTTPTLDFAIALLNEYHALPGSWSHTDVLLLRSIALLVSNRSAALIAASLVALGQALEVLNTDSIVIPCCGAVLERHANYLLRCQAHLNRLRPGIKLQPIQDAGLLGAAVSAAMQESLW